MKNIISEIINNYIEKECLPLNEGYFARQYENLINNISSDIYKHMQNGETKITSSFDVDNLFAGIYVTVNDNEDVHGAYRGNGFTEPSVKLIINSTTTLDELNKLLRHEITHYLDDVKSKETKYRTYKHQYSLMDDDLNEDICDLLYTFWDTSEFNAWQSNLLNNGENFDEVYNNVVERLRELEMDNNPETWQPLKDYFEYALYGVRNKRGEIVQKWKDKPLIAVKNYFIRTTYNKLNKFKQKIRVV